MLEAQLEAGKGEVGGAIGGPAIGEDALDLDAMSLVEVEGLVESVEDVFDLFAWKKAGEAESGMIIDGDMKTFDAGVAITLGAITGGTDAGAREAAQLLDVEVKQLAGVIAFVSNDGRFWRFEGRKTVEAVAAKDAREGGLGEWQKCEDLSVGAALTTQSEDPGLQLRAGSSRLTAWHRRPVFETRRKASIFGALQPAPDGAITDRVGDSYRSAGELFGGQQESDFGSHERS